MRAKLKIFTWLGIPVYLHWSFALILILPAVTFVLSGFQWLETAFTFCILFSLFGSVLLHEYGHAIMARRFGVPTRDIILTPIGGIARLEKMPERPMQEILVALAGPMVNVVIAVLIFAGSTLLLNGNNLAFFHAGLEQQFQEFLAYFQTFFGGEADTESSDLLLDIPFLPYFLIYFQVLNVMLVIFNLIPAFPMDGGRVLRALLAFRSGRVRATNIAAYVGQGMALIFIVVGFTKGPASLVVIGAFVIWSAASERTMVQIDDILTRFSAKDLIRRQFTRLSSSDWMLTPIDLLAHGLERNFLVFDLNEQLIGMIEEDDIKAAQSKNDRSASVMAYMRNVEAVHLNTSLQYVYYLLRQKENNIVAVVDEYGLQGVIDDAGLDYFMKHAGKGK